MGVPWMVEIPWKLSALPSHLRVIQVALHRHGRPKDLSTCRPSHWGLQPPEKDRGNSWCRKHRRLCVLVCIGWNEKNRNSGRSWDIKGWIRKMTLLAPGRGMDGFILPRAEQLILPCRSLFPWVRQWRSFISARNSVFFCTQNLENHTSIWRFASHPF